VNRDQIIHAEGREGLALEAVCVEGRADDANTFAGHAIEQRAGRVAFEEAIASAVLGRSLGLENPVPGLDRHLRNAIISVQDNERSGVVVALRAGRGYG